MHHRTLAGRPTRFPPAEGRRLSWPGWLGDVVYPPKTVTHPSTNRARRRVTSLIRPTMLPLCHLLLRVYLSVDGWFNVIRQLTATCPSMRAHWLHLVNTIELVHPSANSSPQPKRQMDRFSRFCTSYGRRCVGVYFTTGALSTRIALSHGGSGNGPPM